MRSTLFFVALASLSLSMGCDSTSTQTPDRPSTDATEAAVDVASDRSEDTATDTTERDVVTEAAVDATDAAADVVDAGDDADVMVPCALDVAPPDVSGTSVGYIRFANFARGAGTLRFVAHSLPMFAPATVEAVVPEGTATEHIRTLPVAYEVHVTPAPDASAGYSVDASDGDAGVLTDGAASPASLGMADAGPGEVVAPTCTDVYFFAGCTIVLAGSRTGDVTQQRDRHLWRLSDVPVRSNDCYSGRVRTLNWYAEGPAIDVDSTDGTPLARNAAYHETTGYRAVAAGPLRVDVRNNETSAALGTFSAGAVAPGHSHTLHVWGDAREPSNMGVSALVLDDVSPVYR